MISPAAARPDPAGDAAIPAASGNTIVRVWQRLLSAIVQVVYLRFRYDIFISYRRHHKPYVVKLKQQLELLGYRAFVDQEECPPGSALNQTLEGALDRSAALVLVGSDDVDSPYVVMEVSTFGKTGRTIIPIDIDGALSRTQLTLLHERDLVWINENAAALAIGVPSPDVLFGIEANFRYLRRNLRQRIEGVVIAALVIVIAAGSVRYAQRNVALARAQEQQAVGRAALAQEREKTAMAAQEKADAAANAAEERRQEAVRLEAAARRATYEQLGERAEVLAAEPGHEHEALLAGVLAVGPSLAAGEALPPAAVHGVSEAVAAAARSIPMAGGWTFDARISDDGKRIVSLTADGVRWWNSETGALIRHVAVSPGHGRVAFCGDAGLVVVDALAPRTGPSHPVHLWETATITRWRTLSLGEGQQVTSCSRDRRWAAIRGGSGTRLWDLAGGIDIGPIPVLFDDTKFSTDGTRLASTEGIVEIPSRRLIARFTNPVKAPPDIRGRTGGAGFQFASFLGNDRRVATAAHLGNVAIWSADDGTLESSFIVTEPRYGVELFADFATIQRAIVNMSVSPDGTRIAVADADGRITVWSTKPGADRPLRTLNALADEDAPSRITLPADIVSGPKVSGVFTSVRFVDSATIAFMTQTGRVSIRDSDSLLRRTSVQDPQFSVGGDAARSGATPDFTVKRNGQELELVTFGCFAGLRRWSFRSDRFPSSFKDHARLVLTGGGVVQGTTGAAFTGDSRAIVTRTADGRTVAWDRESGAPVRRLPPGSRQVRLLDPWAAPLSGTEELSPLLTPREQAAGTQADSGRFAVSCCRTPAAVWDTAERRRIVTMRGGSSIAQFAPDERDLLTFGGVGTYAVYSLDPAWYLRRACKMLTSAGFEQAGRWCPAR